MIEKQKLRMKDAKKLVHIMAQLEALGDIYNRHPDKTISYAIRDAVEHLDGLDIVLEVEGA